MSKAIKNRIFITDCEQRKSIPIIRALGKNGIKVIGGEASRLSMGFFSKYCPEKMIYPKPEDEDAFIEWLIDTAKKDQFDILFPIDERTMKPVTKNLSKLSKYMAVPVVNEYIYDMANDKFKTYSIAEKIGITVPKTWCFKSAIELKERCDELKMPLIIKPRISSGSRGLRYINSYNELFSTYDEISNLYPEPLIQEFIPKGGDTFGVELLFNQGKLVVYFMHRRLREFPIDGGPSTLRESWKDQAIINDAIKLLEALKWHGVAMVEFKINPKNGKHVLMEINPKFWGSIALPIAVGVNFPFYLYQLSVSNDKIKQPDYKTGVLCRWLLPGDILHFIKNPHRFKMSPGFFKFSGMHYDIISIRDFGPIFGFTLYLFSKLFSKEFWKNKILR